MKKLRRLIDEAAGYRKYLALLPLTALLSVACEVLLPYLMADILDNCVQTGDMGRLLQKGLMMIAASAVLTAAGVARSICVANFSTGYTRNLSDRLFRKTQELAINDTGKFGTASLLTRLSVDMDTIKKALSMTGSLIQCPMMIVCMTVMTARIDLSLSWIFLSVLPVFAVVLLLINRYARRHYREMFTQYDNMNNILEENVAGIKTVKAFVRGERETARFTATAARVRNESRRAEIITALNNPLLQFAVNGCVLLLVLFGGVNIIDGKLQACDLFCLITYANQILSQVLIISLIMVPILSAQVSMERVHAVLDTQPSASDAEADADLKLTDGMVEFRNLSFCYGTADKYALRDIDLTVPSGSFLGITGMSGSSKTTLINLILRFFDASRGSVLVSGHDVKEYKLAALRGAIALVPQTSVLFSGTVAENLRFGCENATDEELLEACRAADAYGFVSELPGGLNAVLEHGGRNLSGGQRQRLCIARALVRKPKILIMDDSLSAVDNLTEARINAALAEQKDMTVIMISQRLSAIRSAERIAVMDNGQISGIGTHDELLNGNEIYRGLYMSQRRQME